VRKRVKRKHDVSPFISELVNCPNGTGDADFVDFQTKTNVGTKPGSRPFDILSGIQVPATLMRSSSGSNKNSSRDMEMGSWDEDDSVEETLTIDYASHSGR
jgi:hypothetical protein